jgi:SAM-dependent methyltransferase
VTFSGEIADYYATYRRGYPTAALDFVVDSLGVGADDLVVDLGCGSGQLAIPLATRARHVLGIDPEPDMLVRGRAAAIDRSVRAVSWMLGTDDDVPTVHGLLGADAVAAVTVSNAIHLMSSARLFANLRDVLGPGGRIAVIANGTPVWLQNQPWSRALRRFLEERFATTVDSACGTDEPSRRRYRAELDAAGYLTTDQHITYREVVAFDWLVGHVYSAMPPHWLPAREDRPLFEQALHDALRQAQPDGAFHEDVRVALLLGRLP